MATTNINVRVDSDLKKEAEDLFHDLGITMSGAITMFLRTAVTRDGIPFELKRMQPNETTISALNEYEEMVKNSDKYKRYGSIDEGLEDIL